MGLLHSVRSAVQGAAAADAGKRTGYWRRIRWKFGRPSVRFSATPTADALHRGAERRPRLHQGDRVRRRRAGRGVAVRLRGPAAGVRPGLRRAVRPDRGLRGVARPAARARDERLSRQRRRHGEVLSRQFAAGHRVAGRQGRLSPTSLVALCCHVSVSPEECHTSLSLSLSLSLRFNGHFPGGPGLVGTRTAAHPPTPRKCSPETFLTLFHYISAVAVVNIVIILSRSIASSCYLKRSMTLEKW